MYDFDINESVFICFCHVIRGAKICYVDWDYDYAKVDVLEKDDTYCSYIVDLNLIFKTINEAQFHLRNLDYKSILYI